MDCDNYKKLLNAYHDNELEKGAEPDVFSHLSGCGECRGYFKNINFISANIKQEEFPDELDERILYSIKEKSIKNSGASSAFSSYPSFPIPRLYCC